MWWYEIYNKKIHGLTWPKFIELGAPKMEAQFLASGPMSGFKKKILLIKYEILKANEIRWIV
jgi:hypothetical protein